jgi:hypothetical protein
VCARRQAGKTETTFFIRGGLSSAGDADACTGYGGFRPEVDDTAGDGHLSLKLREEQQAGEQSD